MKEEQICWGRVGSECGRSQEGDKEEKRIMREHCAILSSKGITILSLSISNDIYSLITSFYWRFENLLHIIVLKICNSSWTCLTLTFFS